jgi:4-amino-4-deoxy-L-arabinose transferase-like glycosyltransferase
MVIAECIVWPQGEFPLNDDWSYTWSAKWLFQHGDIRIGAWPAMTLWTHLVWGLLFLKVFGFSFFILRFSMMVAAFLTLRLLLKIIAKRSDMNAGLAAAITLLACPIFFNLANTYMTDVTFILFAVAALYAAIRFFEEGKVQHFVLVFVFSILLTLVRQYGIALPIAFTFACVFRRIPSRFSAVVLGILGIGLTVGVLKFYEAYLKTTLNEHAAYKFTGKLDPLSRVFYDDLLENFNVRFKWISEYTLTFAAPFCLFLLPGLIRRYQLYITLPLVAISVGTCFYFYKNVTFPLGNILDNMNLGAETFLENLQPDYRYGRQQHTYSETFKSIAVFTGSLLSGISIATLLLLAPGMLIKKIRTNPTNVMVVTFMLMYMLLVLITESFFDRYLLILPVFLMVLIAGPIGAGKSTVPAALVMLVFLTFSVLGTKDYFTMNRLRWDIYYATRQAHRLHVSEVNAGFEINCWEDGHYNHWLTFLEPKKYPYLIQYNAVEGFTEMKAYPFKRWLSNSVDTLKLYRRNAP